MTARIVRFPPWLFPLAVVLLTLVPIVELALLVTLGREVGLVPTLVLCAATGFLGAWLARWQGWRTWMAAQAALGEGRFPAEQVMDGALLLVGGVVLLTPGLVTDALGFTLLLPPGRALIKSGLRRWWERRNGPGPQAPSAGASAGPDIIDAEVIVEEGSPR
jgi:UPF0716 protein FxsA